MLKGVGYAICIIDIYVGMFYNTVIGWAVYYFITSITSAAQVTQEVEGLSNIIVILVTSSWNFLFPWHGVESEYILLYPRQFTAGSVDSLPWTSCANDWNSNSSCVPLESVSGTKSNISSPAEEYFMREVLETHNSRGIAQLGPIKPSLAFSTLAVFVLVYFALWKGVKSTGKVVWVTAIAPYIILFCLLIRGVTLDGADLGIKYYLTPQWEKLFTMKVINLIWNDTQHQ